MVGINTGRMSSEAAPFGSCQGWRSRGCRADLANERRRFADRFFAISSGLNSPGIRRATVRYHGAARPVSSQRARISAMTSGGASSTSHRSRSVFAMISSMALVKALLTNAIQPGAAAMSRSDRRGNARADWRLGGSNRRSLAAARSIAVRRGLDPSRILSSGSIFNHSTVTHHDLIAADFHPHRCRAGCATQLWHNTSSERSQVCLRMANPAISREGGGRPGLSS